MHVALIANTGWLDQELTSFRQMVVGLMDEGGRVAQVVPDNLDEHETIPFGERITWTDSTWTLIRRHRLLRLCEALDELDIDLIHALDPTIWDAGSRIAEELEIPLVATVSDVNHAKWLSRTLRRMTPQRAALAATTQPIADMLQQRLAGIGDIPITTIRHGVYPLDQPRKNVGSGENLCGIITGTGEYDEYYEAVFLALGQIIKDHPDVQFFLDSLKPQQHTLWQNARRHQLLEHITLMGNRLGHREMLVSADVVIQPQPLGASRSLLLQAMGHAVPVLAYTDEWVDYLAQDQTAWLVDAPEAGQWHDLLERIIRQPQTGMDLGERARLWVGEHHRVSTMIDQTLQLYRTITGASIPFPGETPTNP